MQDVKEQMPWAELGDVLGSNGFDLVQSRVTNSYDEEGHELFDTWLHRANAIILFATSYGPDTNSIHINYELRLPVPLTQMDRSTRDHFSAQHYKCGGGIVGDPDTSTVYKGSRDLRLGGLIYTLQKVPTHGITFANPWTEFQAHYLPMLNSALLRATDPLPTAHYLNEEIKHQLLSALPEDVKEILGYKTKNPRAQR